MILEYMIDDKICPIMSRGVFLPDGDHLLATIYCQREKCMAWVLECPRYRAIPQDERDCECNGDDCIREDRNFQECKGGCRLI